MKRSELLGRQLAGRMDAIQTCRDVVEGNFNAHDVAGIDHIELQARIYTDLEILATNQQLPPAVIVGDMLVDVDPADENDYREPSSASR